MLELQLPQPMPHAVPFDRPSGSLSSSSPKQNRPSFQHSQVDSQATLLSSLASQQTWPSYYSGALTPPLEMNGTHGGYGTLQRSGQDVQRGTDRMYGQRPYGQVAQPLPYPNFNQPAHDGTTHYGSKHTNVCRSPISARSTLPAPAPLEKGRGSISSVAPSLRIPDTISTPQTSLPQLAAEVSQGRVSPKVPH